MRALESGELKHGMEILEASTGNAGISCAFIGRKLGFKVTIIMPRSMSQERVSMIRAYGADVTLTPGAESDVDLCLKKVEELKKEILRNTGFLANLVTQTIPLHTIKQRVRRFGNKQRAKLTVLWRQLRWRYFEWRRTFSKREKPKSSNIRGGTYRGTYSVEGELGFSQN